MADAGLNLDDINDGFKRAIIQHALMKSGGEGDFNVESFAKALYGPLKKILTTLSWILQKLTMYFLKQSLTEYG